MADAAFPFQDESHSRYLVGLTNGLVENSGLVHLVYSIGTPENPTLHTGQVLVMENYVMCIASLMQSRGSLTYRYVPVATVNRVVVEEKTVTISSV
jgi:hypothetical protein